MTLTADTPEAFRIVWSLLIALERGDKQTVEAIWQEVDEATLLRGWHVVAGKLRRDLEQHGERLGCDCGSLEWLKTERFNIVGEG